MLPSTPFDDFISLLTQLSESERENGIRPPEEKEADPERRVTFHAALDWLQNTGPEGTPPVLRENHICLFVSNYDHGQELDYAIEFAEKAGRGQTLLNEACKDRGMGLRVLEMAPSIPHSTEKDWPEKDCLAACAFGMEAAAAGGDLLGIATIAGGSDVMVKTMVAELAKIPQVQGAGIDTEHAKNVLECLRKNGGREVAAVIGAVTAARSSNLPVLLEGDGAILALYILWQIDPDSIRHAQVATPASTKALDFVVSKIGKRPIIDLENSYEPGCGIAVAVSALTTLTSIRPAIS